MTFYILSHSLGDSSVGVVCMQSHSVNKLCAECSNKTCKTRNPPKRKCSTGRQCNGV